MHRISTGSTSRRAFVALVALLLAACGGSSAAPATQQTGAVPTSTQNAQGVPSTVGPGPASTPRPSSPATITITSPADGATITGSTVHVAVAVANATVVQATTTNIRPDQGHVHLYLDNALTYMNYTLEQDIPVSPGTWVMKAEFVASDHVPFNPRVWSQQITFTVK